MELQELVAVGWWSMKETNLYINILEKRILLALSFDQYCSVGHLLMLISDNSTVVVYLNKQMGTI